MAANKLTLKDRFLAKVSMLPCEPGCWLWTGSHRNAFGYGGIMDETGRVSLAHRVSYRLYRGPIPDGMCVLHRCDNPPCVNPAHLFLGTNADNMRDMTNKERDGKRKLSAASVLVLREKARTRSAEQFSYREAAKTLGVSEAAVCYAINGTTFRNLDLASPPVRYKASK